MVFPLVKMNKEGTLLQSSYSYYSEEYAPRMCDLYLTDGKVQESTGGGCAEDRETDVAEDV